MESLSLSVSLSVSLCLSPSLSLSRSGTSPLAVSPVDSHVAELQHYMQRETDALMRAKDVMRQLEGIASLDQKALAEVGQ